MRSILVVFYMVCLAASIAAQTNDSPEERLTVASVKVTPNSRISSKNLQVITNKIQSRSYAGDVSEISEWARYALQTQGYLKAQVGNAEVKFVTECARQKTIAVTLAIDQGEQYRLKELTFSKNTVFSSAQLRDHFDIRDGDVFDTDKIRLGLEKLRRLYASNGYINCTPVPNTDADDITRLVSLNIEPDEGAQFRFGELVLAGMEPRAGAGYELISAWKPHIGSVYDPKVVENFWNDHVAPLLPPGSRFDHAVEESKYAEQKIVNVRISFP